jgi:DDE superfamily endonuclease
MRSAPSDWKDELAYWLKPFLEHLGHKARRRMCPLYVTGLIGPGDRKSVQPMAARLAPGDYDQLHHFVAAGVWDAAPLETELLVQADRLVGGSDAVLVIDDTAMPKKGNHSVGVAPQYASAKNANCQTLVSLTLARGEVPAMLALRLFLPESWTSDQARLKRAGVPLEYRTARTKPEIALAEIDRVIAAGVRFGCVLAERLRAERAVSSRAHDSQPYLGGRHPSSPQGVPCRGAAHLARCQAGPPAPPACSGYSIDAGRRHAGRCQVANCELANRHKRQAQGPLCRCPCTHRRRTTAADQG